MIKHILLLIVLFLSIPNLIAQKPLDNDKLLELSERELTHLHRFFNNRDYMLGFKYSYRQRAVEGRPYYLKAINSFIEEGEWKGYCEATNDLLATYQTTENYKEGIKVGHDALDMVKEKSPKDTLETIFILNGIGQLYSLSYEPESAMKIFKKQLRYSFDLYKIDTSYKIGFVYNSIGIEQKSMGRLDSALYYFKKAETSFLNARDCRNCYNKLQTTYENFGVTYELKGNYEKAILNYQKAHELSRSRKDKYHELQEVNVLLKLGRVYKLLEEADEAESNYRRAIFQIKRIKAKDKKYSVGILSRLNNALGNIYYEQELYDQAETFFDTASFILKNSSIFIPQKIETLFGQGKIQRQKGNYANAIEILNQAENLSEKHIQSSGDQSLNFDIRSGIQLEIAKIEFEKGNLAASKSRFLSQKDSIVKYNQAKGKGYISANFELAEIYNREGKMDSAFHYNQQALFGGAKSELADETLPSSFQSLNELYQVFLQKAAFFEKKNDLSNALVTLKKADLFHEENLKKTSLLRAGKNKTLCLAATPIYENAIRISNQIGEAQGIADAYSFTQKMKARQLLLTLLNSDAKAFAGIDESFMNKEKELISEIEYYKNEVRKSKKDTYAKADITNVKIFNLENEYRKLLVDVEAKNPEYFEMKYRFSSTAPEKIQELLSENELLIEYVFTSQDQLYIFFISKKDGLQSKEIKIKSEIQSQIAVLNKTLRKSTMARESSRTKFINLNHQIYQQLLQPIEDQLVGKDRLIIIGDGMTNYIPFEVLLKSNEVKPFNELDFLVKNHEISYHYSATLFAKTKEKEPAENEGIYAFAPVYEQNATDDLLAVRREITRNSTLRAYNEDGTFSPLPESEREVNAIINLFKKSGDTNHHLDLKTDATEASLKSNLEKPYKYIHIAGHSFADLENPKFSGIACFDQNTLTPDTSAVVEDGTLYTGEIYNIASQADLVTLSSCESGFGKLEKTEGLLGLNRAFIYAGAPNVVFSLWKVYDKISANLMTDFYKNMLEGKSYSTSLREAKLKLLEKEETASPHFWSPFLLIGR